MEAKIRIELAEMPFDKFVDGNFIHATGDAVILEDGSYWTEYEGEEYPDAENCIYLVETRDGYFLPNLADLKAAIIQRGEK